MFRIYDEINIKQTVAGIVNKLIKEDGFLKFGKSYP
jgi:hypothetical protein